MTDSQDRDPADRGHQARALCMAGFDAFYMFYRTRLVRFVKVQGSNASWAEDVADDTMMAALDKWDFLLTYDRPDSWLFKVASRKLRQLEAQARRHCYLKEDLASSSSDLKIAAAQDEWVADHLDLITGMRSLPRRQCDVIALHHFGGYSIRETAQILEIKVATVKTHLYRGLQALRQHQGAPAAAGLTGRTL
jgi:RNA polymerase sigma factor (sigma-70 family)